MPNKPIITKVNPPEIFECLYLPKRYKLFWGGRGGGKTYNICDALVILAALSRKIIICGRQFQNSIEDSVKTKIETSIVSLGLSNEFHITEKKIVHKGTRSEFKFKGLDRNIISSKGWEDVDILWIEEANVIKQYALELILPTIRKPGSEIWFSMNRGARTDPIDKMFLSKGIPKEIKDNAFIVKVGWKDNPYFTKELELERQICLKQRPERYSHIWDGEADDLSGATKVLSYAKLLKCVDAHIKLKYKSPETGHSGLDVADEGNDTNSWSGRYGSLLKIVREWKVKYLHMTASKADSLNNQNNILNMHYDAGGLGAGMKSDLSRIKTNPQTGISTGEKKFIPFLFNGKVNGPNKYFIRHKSLKVKNKDFFHRANSQLWWNLRLRVENTLKALDGEKVDLDYCFFIDSRIDDIEKILAELNQCVYDDTRGKIKVDKAPDGAISPNNADSINMAFANDIKKGLKAA